MEINIKRYHHADDYEKLRKLIESEGEEWESYLKPEYRERLEQSITYVAYVEKVLCGYVRSMNDTGYFIWIIDLLVDERYRGHSIGRQLMERTQSDFPKQDVFVMSDVDKYYHQLAYKKVGSIFRIE